MSRVMWEVVSIFTNILLLIPFNSSFGDFIQVQEIFQNKSCLKETARVVPGGFTKRDKNILLLHVR